MRKKLKKYKKPVFEEKKPVIKVKKPPASKLKPIISVARSIGINKKYVELRGVYKAKISTDIMKSLTKRKKGKYILVTSITPTHFGEGKTVTAIGLSMAFNKLKKRSIACIPQPSLGGIFGLKGVGTGSGRAQALPAEDANLYFTGDNYAVEAANNLCAAYLDNTIYKVNPLDIDQDSITWRRVTEINDRFLRNINVGLGSKADGAPRKTGFNITASSELMAILSLCENPGDLKARIGKIILGFTKKKGKPVTCDDIKATGAMAALLKDAIKPNLIQTSEGTACFMHAGSFANLSIGGSSVLADKIALSLSDYVITESGFGADMGAEKFLDIKCRASGLAPDVAVIACTIRGLKMHSGDFEINPSKPLPKDLSRESVSSVERGFSNLEKQISNLKNFGIPVIVCINRFGSNTEKEIAAVKKRAHGLGADMVTVCDAWAAGSEGAIELAKFVLEACKKKPNFRFLYPLDMPIKDKIKRIAKTIYGAKEVVFSEDADKKALQYKKSKLDSLPVNIVKTHLSLSHSPKRKGRPHGFKLPVEDLEVCNGAGYISAICDDINRVPGLPKVSRGLSINLNEEGKITGLF